MPLDQFVIALDNPSMSYFPGQMVTGRVVVRANSDKKSQGLTLKFQGKASVHWSEEKTESRGSGDNRTSEKVTKYYDDSESFFDFKSYLLGDGRSDVVLPTGDSQYPFTFQLPPMNLPSSYVGNYGKVEYVLEANVKRSWKFDYNVKQYITVNAIVDLNNEHGAAEPGVWNTSKTFCCLCCTSGPLAMTVRTNSQGYCSGENIELEVEVNNQSTKTINDVSAVLVQEAYFFAEGNRQQFFRTLVDTHRGEGVPAGETEIWRLPIKIPPVPPTKLGGCRIIDVKYVLKVKSHVSGMGFNLQQDCGITVGTVPLRSRFELLRPADTMPSAPPLFTPSGYNDLPPPQYQDSHNFKEDPQPKDTIVENITDAVIDRVAPTDPDYVPKYVTYGWNFHIPPNPNGLS